MRILLFSLFILLSGLVLGQSLSLYKEKGKYGFKNSEGKFIIPAQYEDALEYSFGLALVKSKEKWGYIDTNGTTVIPFELDKGQQLRGNLARVLKNGKYGLVSNAGYVLDPIYEKIESNYFDKEEYEVNYQEYDKPTWLTLYRNNEKILYSVVQDREYGPFKTIEDVIIGNREEYRSVWIVELENGQFMLFDEVHNLWQDEITYFHQDELEVLNTKVNIFVYQAHDTSFIYNNQNGTTECFATKKFKSVSVIDMTDGVYHDAYEHDDAGLIEYDANENQEYEYEGGEETNSYVEFDEYDQDYRYLLLIQHENDQITIVNEKLETLVEVADETDQTESHLYFSVNEEWGAIDLNDGSILDPIFRYAPYVLEGLSRECGRTIFGYENIAYDPLTQKSVIGYSYETEIVKEGKWQNIGYYKEYDDGEQLITLFENKYMKIIPLNDLVGFDEDESFSIFYVQGENGKFGIIDIFENEIINIELDKIEYDEQLYDMFSDLMRPVILHKGKESAIYDFKTRKTLTPFSVKTYDFDEDYIEVAKVIVYAEKGYTRVLYYDFDAYKFILDPLLYKRFEFLDWSYILLLQDENNQFYFWSDRNKIKMNFDKYIEDLYDFHWVQKEGSNLILNSYGEEFLSIERTPNKITIYNENSVICDYKKESDLYISGLDPAGEVIQGLTYYTTQERIVYPERGDFEYFYLEDKIWYATMGTFKKEVNLGKSAPLGLYEVNGQLIRQDQKGKIYSLTNMKTGKSISDLGLGWPEFYEFDGKTYILCRNLKAYFDENLNKIPYKQ